MTFALYALLIVVGRLFWVFVSVADSRWSVFVDYLVVTRSILDVTLHSRGGFCAPASLVHTPASLVHAPSRGLLAPKLAPWLLKLFKNSPEIDFDELRIRKRPKCEFDQHSIVFLVFY